jgi:hypothetical protein
MGNDRVLFDITDEFIDEEKNIFKGVLNARKYGHTFEIFINGKLLYKETDENSKALSLDMPPDSTFDDKKRFCTDCYESVFYLGQKITNSTKIEAELNAPDYVVYKIIASRFFAEALSALKDETVVEGMENIDNAPDVDLIKELWRELLLKPGTRNVIKSLIEVATYLARNKAATITAEFFNEHFLQKDGSKFSQRNCEEALATYNKIKNALNEKEKTSERAKDIIQDNSKSQPRHALINKPH